MDPMQCACQQTTMRPKYLCMEIYNKLPCRLGHPTPGGEPSGVRTVQALCAQLRCGVRAGAPHDEPRGAAKPRGAEGPEAAGLPTTDRLGRRQ